MSNNDYGFLDFIIEIEEWKRNEIGEGVEVKKVKNKKEKGKRWFERGKVI